MHSFFDPTEITTRQSPIPLAGYLKSTFPEIANAVTIFSIHYGIYDIGTEVDQLSADSSFFSMFDVKIVEGSMSASFINYENRERKIAITREKALQLFGNESPVGKRLGNSDICAVITSLPKHSNYPFDILILIKEDENWLCCMHTLVELVPDIDMKAFEKKLYEHEVPVPQRPNIKNMTLTPLTSVHYKDPNIVREVQFQHIIIFAVAGLLLILCTLFNYLTLFVSRFRMRQRELALRTVYGASVQSLFAMLSVELIISLIFAFILGLGLINILDSSFLTVSGIRLELSAIYIESIIYIAGIIAIVLTSFFLTLVIFKRLTLDSSIRHNTKILRRTSIVIQLTVSIVFTFCTLVIFKQMYYLHNSADLGFSFKNRGSINVFYQQQFLEVLNDKMKQIPEIKETIIGVPLLPLQGISNTSISDWDGKQGNVESIRIFTKRFSEEEAKFYEFDMIEGEFFSNKRYIIPSNKLTEVLINESAAKIFGWDKAVGKSFWQDECNGFVVKGVVKNIYKLSPTIAARPFFYHPPNIMPAASVLFKYEEGKWKTCMKKIKKIVEEEFSHKDYSFFNMEEEYDKYFKSENTLLAIFTIVSLICVIICVFGFVSIVSLTCEERRKEIAIRKINGATVKDILDIFFKEYLTLLAIGALIAFSVGYIMMKRWLQNYVIQTEISAWVYLSILLVLIMIIVLCVGGRVYKTCRENPVNALNK
jgi:ABC-type antimicrobial peptide transport system permease subunit